MDKNGFPKTIFQKQFSKTIVQKSMFQCATCSQSRSAPMHQRCVQGMCTLANASANSYLLKHVLSAQTSTFFQKQISKNGFPKTIFQKRFSTNNFPKNSFPKTVFQTVFGEPKRVGLFVERLRQAEVDVFVPFAKPSANQS